MNNLYRDIVDTQKAELCFYLKGDWPQIKIFVHYYRESPCY